MLKLKFYYFYIRKLNIYYFYFNFIKFNNIICNFPINKQKKNINIIIYL